MTDTIDDIAEEISFQSFDDDCRLPGNLLNDTLQREVGPSLVDKLERIRVLVQSGYNLRQAGIVNMVELLEKQLTSELLKMTLEEALTLAHAFSHYFTLMGIAETHHRGHKERKDGQAMIPAKMSSNPAPCTRSCEDSLRRYVQFASKSHIQELLAALDTKRRNDNNDGWKVLTLDNGVEISKRRSVPLMLQSNRTLEW